MIAVMPPKEFMAKMYLPQIEQEDYSSQERTLDEKKLLKRVAKLLDTRSYDDTQVCTICN
jgi:hypothetical protein